MKELFIAAAKLLLYFVAAVAGTVAGLLIPISAAEALRRGATHHAYFWGIPCWASADIGRVGAKWPVLGGLVFVFGRLEYWLTGEVGVAVGPKIEEN